MTNQDPKAFIRSMPNASPADVVSAAKKAGMSVQASYVERLRIIDRARAASANGKKSGQGGKKAAKKAAKAAKAVKSSAKPASAPSKAAAPAPKAAPKAAAKSAGKSKASSGRSSPKKEAVLAIGLDKPTSEILAAAQRQGLTITRAYVDILRKQAGLSGEKRKPGRPKKAVAAAPVAAKRKPGRPKKAAAPAAPAAAPVKRGPGRPRKTEAPAAAAPAAAAARKPGRPPTAAVRSSGGGEAAFRSAVASVVLESGAGHARQLLEQVVAKIRASAG